RGEREPAGDALRHWGDVAYAVVLGRAAAELTPAIVAPTECLVRQSDAAGVIGAGGQRAKARVRGDGDWRRTIGSRAVAQLSRRVLSPAESHAARREGATVSIADSHALECRVGAHCDGSIAAAQRAVAEITFA